MANSNRLIKPKWELYDITEENIEHKLFEDYIVEFTDISGIKINYYIRDESIEMDTLYGESVNTAYSDAYSTKLIYEVTDEVSITNSFGIVSEEMIQYGFIPKFTYGRDVSIEYDPKPGDVIKTLWNDRSYEIIDVGEEAHIFQLKKMVWEFILKPYRYSEQSDSAKSILKTPDSTLSDPITAYGNNEWIEEESDDIDTYSDVDSSVYGY